eukprot:TRINITY_DN3141_c0_g1_i2.p1 TRINITY_DN3141_c0_g1~~TRINITY_DN3141_c0_g1_i2.p1  ORF type:complete len:135 (-),score=23.45 TRINITY_DN3141_c0_g1_i2:403-807(-)
MFFFDFFFFQAEDGIRDLVRSRGLGDVYKRQILRPASDGIRSPTVQAERPSILKKSLSPKRSQSTSPSHSRRLSWSDQNGGQLAQVKYIESHRVQRRPLQMLGSCTTVIYVLVMIALLIQLIMSILSMPAALDW